MNHTHEEINNKAMELYGIFHGCKMVQLNLHEEIRWRSLAINFLDLQSAVELTETGRRHEQEEMCAITAAVAKVGKILAVTAGLKGTPEKTVKLCEFLYGNLNEVTNHLWACKPEDCAMTMPKQN